MIVGTNHPVKARQIWEHDTSYVKTGAATFELIVDPSDSMILGRFFRYEDISASDRDLAWDHWVAGTEFRSSRTGKIVEIYDSTRDVLRRGKIVKKITRKFRYAKPSDQLELNL